MRLLGNLVCPAATSVNNRTTATPFVIPASTKTLWFRTAILDAHVAVDLDAAATPTLAATVNDFPLSSGSAYPAEAPPQTSASKIVCAAFSTGGGSIAVFREP